MHRIPGPDGLQLAADTWGEQDAPPVILLHGSGQTRHAWKGIGQRLASLGYRAIAFDARGHGDSDWDPRARYDHNAMVDDLRHVVAALGRGRPALVGASRGGATSLIAIGEGKVDASALVLVDIAPRLEADGVERIRTFMQQAPEGFATLEDVASAISAYQPHRPKPRSLHGLAKNVRLGPDGRYHWHWDPRSVLSRSYVIERARRLAACATRISIPTLLVKGQESDVLTEAGVREFLAACPQAEFVNVADAAHMVAGDRNDIFGNAVLDFVVRHVSRATP